MIQLLKYAFEYHHFFNQKLMEEFTKHMSKLSGRTFPLFCHVINSHQVWFARINGTMPVGVKDVYSI